MKIINIEQLLQLHVVVIKETGGSNGLRDLGRLEAALATQAQEVFGEELYKTIFEKAAALIRGTIGDHPFVDGNKRTGILAGITLMEINGFKFVAKARELEDFAVKVAVDKLDVPAIAEWLEKNSKKR